MIFALLLFANVVCVDNGDGSWTCTGSSGSPGYPPGVETNAQGLVTCTNCVNMTPSECLQLKQSLLDYIDSVDGNFSDIQSRILDDIFPSLDSMISKFSSFTDFPYSFPYSTGLNRGAEVNSLVASILGLSAASSSDYDAAASKLLSEWTSSPNYALVSVSPSFSPQASTTTQRTLAFAGFASEVAGLWHGSYSIADNVLDDLLNIRSDVDDIGSISGTGITTLSDMRSDARSITCDPCVLGSGDSGGGSGGGSGVDQGCRECYLVYLRRFQEQFESMDRQLKIIASASTNILEVTQNGFRMLQDNLTGISNVVQRIDDYLYTDQSNMLSSVQSAIVVISNNIDTLQRHYYHTFSNASDITTGQYGSGSPSMEEVFQSIFKPKDQGGFQLSEYQKYDWFRRIELQLSQISGIFSETNVDSVSDSDYNSMKNAVEDFEDLSDGVSSSGGSIVSVGSSLRSAAQSIGNIFPSSAPPGEITLLEAQYWIGDTDLVLRTDFQVVSFCRALFGLIWVTLACVGLWLLLSRSWVILFDTARWFCNWFPKIFGN